MFIMQLPSCGLFKKPSLYCLLPHYSDTSVDCLPPRWLALARSCLSVKRYQVVAISKGPLTVCWEERLRHASWTCSMSTLLLVCSLAPALESHYCCGARKRWRRSRLFLSHRFALFLWLSDNKGSQVKGGRSVIKWAILRGGCWCYAQAAVVSASIQENRAR